MRFSNFKAYNNPRWVDMLLRSNNLQKWHVIVRYFVIRVILLEYSNLKKAISSPICNRISLLGLYF